LLYSKKKGASPLLQEEGYLTLHVNMIETSVGPPQSKKHTHPKWVYKKYETYNTNMESPKPNSLEKPMGHNPP